MQLIIFNLKFYLCWSQLLSDAPDARKTKKGKKKKKKKKE